MKLNDIVYVLVNGAMLAIWLKVVYAYFANRPTLNATLQMTKPRHRGRVIVASLALPAVTIIPVFTGWASWWLLPIALIIALMSFFVTRSRGEADSRAAGWRRSNELTRLASEQHQ